MEIDLFHDRECILVPRGCASLGAKQKERGLWGRECQEWQAIESITDIAQRDGNVFLFYVH